MMQRISKILSTLAFNVWEYSYKIYIYNIYPLAQCFVLIGLIIMAQSSGLDSADGGNRPCNLTITSPKR